jgi:Gene product 88
MSSVAARMTVKSAVETAGLVSIRNSKMPGSTFAISAKECKTGGKLAAIEGSVCSKCYAIKAETRYPSVAMGWGANYLKAVTMIEQAPERWADAMAFQIRHAAVKTGKPFHRWFDSGDLQSVAMLRAIVLTCERTVEIKHWLPTREAKIVRDYIVQYGDWPANLTIRVSSTMVGDKPRNFTNTSTVHRKGQEPAGHVCPASKQGNACGDCRACWSRTVGNVSYLLH